MQKSIYLWALLALAMPVAAQKGRFFYTKEILTLKVPVAPAESLGAKEIVLIPTDETANELASTLMNAFLKYNDVYMEKPGDIRQKLKRFKNVVGIELQTIASEFQETETRVENEEQSYAGSVTGATAQQTKQETYTYTTAVRLKLGVKVYDKSGRLLKVTDFSVSNDFEGNEVTARGLAIAELEQQIRKSFLPSEEVYRLEYVTDPKYGLNKPWPSVATGDYDRALTLAEGVLTEVRENIQNLEGSGDKKSLKKAKKWRTREARALYDIAVIQLARSQFDASRHALTQAAGILEQSFYGTLERAVPAVEQQRRDYAAYMNSVGKGEKGKKEVKVANSFKDKLKKLKDAYEAGLLTEEEYKTKKTALLDAL